MKEQQAIKLFNEFLDDIYDQISVCGYEYSPSDLLESVDPIAYREEFLNWCDAENIEVDDE